MQMLQNAKSDVESNISLIVSPLASLHPDEWILNSGCTYHMCVESSVFKL